MMSRSLMVVALVMAGALCNARAETNATAVAGRDDVDWSRQILQAYKDYQQQQEQTAAALQKARDEVAAANTAAQKAAAENETRLRRIESSLALEQERNRQLEALQQSHSQTLLLVISVAVLVVVGALALAFYIMRSFGARVTTLAPIPSHSPPSWTAGGDAALVTLNPAEQSSARFLAVIDRLEKRLQEMESHMPAAHPVHGHAGSNGDGESPRRVALMLGKGQTLLNLGKPEEALACFDEALEVDPGHAEAHVKRGAALEKLERLDDAIASYDQAIALDDTLTMAYLCKGGVFNRLERYSEALQCYEQALQSQDKVHAA